ARIARRGGGPRRTPPPSGSATSNRGRGSAGAPRRPRHPRRRPPPGRGGRRTRLSQARLGRGRPAASHSHHSSSDEPAVPGDSSPVGAGPSAPPSPASVIASSTAESKSSPSSSPNSLPIFFMKRATLAGSFSSRSPTPPPPASDSSRASSDFTVAKRDISRLSAVEPQRGQAGVSGDERRRTSRLTRRRQSWHSYS